MKIRSAVRRNHAESYLLISLVAFGVTIIAVRAFLQITGFPQIGNSVLHIAHAIWGGLLLFIAVLLPLIFSNRWAIQASALLSGIGFGLFIDEVGKFITQTNDYFFPPALSIIYVIFLITLVLYLYLRRPQEDDPRAAMYHALDGLKDALDGDMDTAEAARIEILLAVARESDREDVVVLAEAIASFLSSQSKHLVEASPGFWRQITLRIDNIGKRVGRPLHRHIISGILLLFTLLAIGYVVIIAIQRPSLDQHVVQWRSVLLTLELVFGVLLVLATAAWLSGNERRGLRFALAGFIFSLVALQSIYLFLSQFQAVTFTLIQFLCLMIFLAYRRWYLQPETVVVDNASSAQQLSAES